MNKFLKISYIVASVLMLASCKKFVDVNDNLTQATDTRARFVFSAALNNTFRNQISGVVHIVPGSWVGHYGHSTSFTGGGSEKTYSFTSADFNAWDGLYDNLNDYTFVIKNADKDNVGHMKDPANVMQCYVFQQLVDMYGDIPYTEALKGPEISAPKFTKDSAVYSDLVVRLDSAMARMLRTTWPNDATINKQDIYFQGNKDKWVRFANTLKLRILMRQSFMPGRDAYITANINTTIANGYIQENVLVTPGYQAVAGKLNPFYSSYGYNENNTLSSNHQYRKMGAAIINWLKTGTTSPNRVPNVAPAATAACDTFRLQALAWPAGTEGTAVSANPNLYVGIPLGAGAGYATANASPIGPFVIQKALPTAPPNSNTRQGMFMLLSESFFLRAEAAVRYGITFGSSDQLLYEAGVRAHFRTLAPLAYAAANNYGNAANAGDAFATSYLGRAVPYQGWAASSGSTADKIRAILIQKWVSLVHINGLEAWSDYRKSTVSASSSVPYSPKSVQVGPTDPEPVRYLYPQTEINTNSNVPKNIDRFTSKIFWDVN